ncbi:MAG: nucleotidyltransferase family protein [Streptosporangiaceae bacterium]
MENPVVHADVQADVQAGRHACPAVRPSEARELAAHVRGEPWLVTALDAVAASCLPDAWIGAGVIRDIVWGRLHDGFDPAVVNDIDVAFFDAGDLRPERDRAAQRLLGELADLPWEATNQAAVHTWYHTYFGGPPIPPFTRVHDAVATWPETATCVAIRVDADALGGLAICAPYGLADLLDKTWRWNQARVPVAISQARLARQRVHQRWPSVTIVPPAPRR